MKIKFSSKDIFHQEIYTKRRARIQEIKSKKEMSRPHEQRKCSVCMKNENFMMCVEKMNELACKKFTAAK